MSDQYRIWTETMPIFDQPSLEFRQDLRTNFYDLLEEPLSVLNTILEAMQQYWISLNAHLDEIRETLDKNARTGYFNDLRDFNEELDRFQHGIEVMEQYPMVMQAFNLINETFSRCLPRWRLFQLVFIVSQIPDIAVRQFPEISAHLDEVSVIYFPTGGGRQKHILV